MFRSPARAHRSLQAIALVAIAVMAPVSVAFACTQIGSLDLAASSPGSHGQNPTMSSGQVIQLTGGNWFTGPAASPVRVYWDAKSGTPLWAGRATTEGTITLFVTIPQANPGPHFLGATQTDATIGGSKGKAEAVYGVAVAAPQSALITQTGSPPAVSSAPGDVNRAPRLDDAISVPPPAGSNRSQTHPRASGRGVSAAPLAALGAASSGPSGTPPERASVATGVTQDLWSGFGPNRSHSPVGVTSPGATGRGPNRAQLTAGILLLLVASAAATSMLVLRRRSVVTSR